MGVVGEEGVTVVVAVVSKEGGRDRREAAWLAHARVSSATL